MLTPPSALSISGSGGAVTKAPLARRSQVAAGLSRLRICYRVPLTSPGLSAWPPEIKPPYKEHTLTITVLGLLKQNLPGPPVHLHQMRMGNLSHASRVSFIKFTSLLIFPLLRFVAIKLTIAVTILTAFLQNDPSSFWIFGNISSSLALPKSPSLPPTPQKKSNNVKNKRLTHCVCTSDMSFTFCSVL